MADGRGDAALIVATRSGDEQAYGELYRRHRSPALQFARSLTRHPADAEDLVADAFTRVLSILRSGAGPAEAFRPYLYTVIRNAFYEDTRRAQRERPVDEIGAVVETASTDDTADRHEHRLAAAAFRQLPERWQVVLWHTAVEGEKPAEVARVLGISPNAAAALAYRAREGLRERYLQAHVRTATDPECRPTVERLGAYLRDRLSRREAQQVRRHLDRCGRCRLLFTDLADVNSRLGAIVGPLVLGGAAAGYLTASGSAAGSASAAPSLLWRLVGSREARIGAGVGAGAVAAALVLALAWSPQQAPAMPGPGALPTGTTVPAGSAPAVPALPTGTAPPDETAPPGAPPPVSGPAPAPSVTDGGTAPPGDGAAATARAIVITISGGVSSTGTVSASTDGGGATDSETGSYSGLPGQSVVPSSTMKQVAVAHGDGSAAACAGLLGIGGQFQLTDDECTVTLASPVTLTLGLAGPAAIMLRANAIVAECSRDNGSVVARTRLDGLQIISSLLGIETVLATIAPNPQPNTGITIPGLLSLVLNEQTTSGGTTTVTALRLSALGTLATVEIATVSCGGPG